MVAEPLMRDDVQQGGMRQAYGVVLFRQQAVCHAVCYQLPSYPYVGFLLTQGDIPVAHGWRQEWRQVSCRRCLLVGFSFVGCSGTTHHFGVNMMFT